MPRSTRVEDLYGPALVYPILLSGLSYDLPGFTTGMDGSTAKRNQDIGQAVLEHALIESGHASKRSFTSVEEFRDYFHKKGTILIDATEQRTQRPGDSADQKNMYSGKKSPHG